jgi:hypothetical protein
MPDPHDTLAIFAEVSVALAGFSGIVIAFGKRSQGSLNNLELRRLSNLFALSGLVLILSLLGISLLHTELDPSRYLWRWASAAILLFVVPWLLSDIFKIRRLEAPEKARVNWRVFYAFNFFTVCVLVLQFANYIFLREAWPFFIALTLAVAGAFQQFILLVRMEIRGR